MRQIVRISATASWSRRLALLALQLFLLTLVLHRFAGLATPVAMQLFAVAVFGAAVALALACAALVGIWRDGTSGTSRALVAVVASAVVMAGPAWSLPSLLMLPRVTEVSTDAAAPPEFRKLATLREDTLRVEDVRTKPEVATELPMLEPLLVKRSPEDAFTIAREAATNLGWRIVAETPPDGGRPGTIEAVDRSLLFGFTGDIALRITSVSEGARIDVRSASRYGSHDLGENASRVENLFAQVRTSVAKLEKSEEIARLARLRSEREAAAERDKASSRAGRGYDSVSRQWREPQQRSTPRASERRAERRTRQDRRHRSTQELRRFWERMQD
jgi:uncharacterized protein (DUF1499 family)